MLAVKDLSVSYGGINALSNVSLEVGAKEIVTLIGANGAGKSTMLYAIMGLVPKTARTVSVFGVETVGLNTSNIVRRGISLVTETRDLFLSLSVRDNLRLGHFLNTNKATFGDGYDNIYALFPRLKDKVKQLAGTLSGGEQQMLAIGRALMQRPKYLLLDEPSLGLSPKLTEELFEKILVINKEGTAVLLVEQRAKLALQVSTRGYLLTTGTVAVTGTSAELSKDELVKKVYFGD
jgi:branched-chain amino acid transport system ATP-binding protein